MEAVAEGKLMTGPGRGGEVGRWGGEGVGVSSQWCHACQTAHLHPLVQEPGGGGGGEWRPFPAIFTVAAAAKHPPPPLKKPPRGSTYYVPGLRWHFLPPPHSFFASSRANGVRSISQVRKQAQRGTHLSKVTQLPRRQG